MANINATPQNHNATLNRLGFGRISVRRPVGPKLFSESIEFP